MSILAQMKYFRGASFNAPTDISSQQTNASVKAAPGTGFAIYITDVIINMGGTSRNIQLLNGSGGTVLYSATLAANTSTERALKTPIKLSAATALCVTTAGASTGAWLGVNGFVAQS